MKKKDLISNLAPQIEAFINFKHSLGIKYGSSMSHLRSLDGFNYSHGNSDCLRKETVEGWINWKEALSKSQDRSWVPPIREFGRYLRSIGFKDAYVIDNRYKMQKYHANVYLMSETEIEAFFKTCDIEVLKTHSPGRPFVLPALYRFLYCCGVRCCEVRRLKCSDVHLDKSFVDIMQSKAYRDRRLYLSQELAEYLKKYDTAISTCFPSREYFFPSPLGGMYSSSPIATNFRNIWLAAGLKRDGKTKARAFDFRHHFACKNIIRWSKKGKDVHAMLPYLMRYMGHSSLESTYYYIHLTPDFFPLYKTLASSTESIIPEVEEYEI